MNTNNNAHRADNSGHRSLAHRSLADRSLVKGWPAFWRRTGQALLTLWTATATMVVLADPQGGSVTFGEGNIGRIENGTTVINQLSDRISIDWESFNVAVNERVVFQQPSSSATALNRIFDQNPSQIFGAIDANGRILLLNPNGILFGETAQVNIQSLVASSLELSLEDFKSGNYDLNALANSHGSAIINHGLIQAASGGSVSLVGDTVVNDGVIVAEFGQVNLAAGRQATVDFDGDGLLLFAVDAPVTENAQGIDNAVLNTGKIIADGGQVLMAANTAQDVFSNVVNNAGKVRAMRIDNSGGVVRLLGSGGTVAHSGQIDVSSDDGTGGLVEMTSERVGLFGSAHIDASGRDGGGVVHIGGGVQGGDESIENADYTYVSQDAIVRADAIEKGDGGEVVVWSDIGTRVHGDLSARGGADGGDGGFIETSGKQGLVVSNTPDVTAERGKGGEWLIDPFDITIVDGNGAGVGINQTNPFESFASMSTIGAQLIADALFGGMNVTVTTGDSVGDDPGNITLAMGATLNFEGGDGGTLTLTALNDIIINGVIQDSGGFDESLNLVFTATNNILISSDGMINLGANGGFDGTAVSFDNAGSLMTGGGTGISLTLGGDFTNTGTLDAGTEAVDVTAGGNGNDATLNIGGTITGAGNSFAGDTGGDNFNISTSVVGNVLGGNGNDVFTLIGSGAATLIDGQGATDRLVGANDVNIWTITGNQAGNVDGQNFVRIESLTGGSMMDTFTINADLGGTVNGGLGDDVFILDGGTVTGPLNGNEGTDSFTVLAGAASAINGNDGNDTLTVDDGTANTWTISTANTGDVDGLAFNLVENLTGAANNDVFNVNAALTGNITGGNGSNEFNISAIVGGNVLGGSATDVFTLIGSGAATLIDGQGATDRLVGANDVNIWTITGNQAGNVDGQNFVRIESLTGGSMMDTFTINADLGGTVNGGLGDDVFILDGGTVTGPLNGNEGTDSFTVLAGAASAINGNDGNDTLTVDDGTANTWTISTANTGDVDGLAFNLVENLTGAANNDVFNVNAALTGNITGGNGSNEFNISAIVGGNVLGGSATDVFTLIGSGAATLIDGQGATDRLVGANDVNIWTITGNQAGNVDGQNFVRIESLTGGSMMDTFTINADLGGTVNGGLGDDVFILDGGTVTGPLNGNEGTDSFTVLAGAASAINGNDGNDTLTVDDGTANTWTISTANTGDVDGLAFNLVENLTGAANNDVFNVNAALTGNITGGNGSNEFNISAIVGGNVLGGSATDVFTLIGSGAATLIDGQGATDRLVGANDVNIWTITGNQAGNVDGQNFVRIESLTGGSMMDTFTINADLGGTVNGGLGDDVFILDGGTVTGPLNGNEGTDSFTVLAGAASAINGNDGNDTLTVDDGTANTWTISTANTGDVDGLAFNLVENLTGAANNDVFNVNAALTGNITGGNGSNEFNISAIVGGNVLGGSATDVFTLIGSGAATLIDGQGATDRLVGANDVNIWTITGNQAGNVDGQNFVRIESLTGGSMMDTFTINADLGGTVNGGLGDDVFILDGGTVTGPLNGNEGTDSFTVLAGAASAINGNDGNDTLTVDDGTANTWTISTANTGDVDGLAFNLVENLTGGTDMDTFNVNADISGNILGGNGPDIFNIADGIAVSNLNGGGGDDRFDFAGAFTVTTINGGANNDTVDFADVGGPITVLLTDLLYASIESFVGNGNATLESGMGDDDWFVDALTNDGTVLLDGTTLINFSAFTMLDAGMGLDSQLGPDDDVTWTVNIDGDIESATLTLPTILSIENFSGGTGIDIFNIDNSFAGSISGGDGNDVFNINAAVTGDLSGGIGNDSFLLFTGGMANLIDGNDGTDTLTGDSTVMNTWTIDMLNTGMVNTQSFRNIENLIGGADIDLFDVNAALDGNITGGDGDNEYNIAAAVSGTITGGGDFDDVTLIGAGSVVSFDGGGDFDSLEGSSTTDNTWTMQTLTTGNLNGTTGYSNVEEIIGGAMNDTLIGSDTVNDWDVDMTNAGTLNSLVFSQIENLSGGIGTDIFTVNAQLDGNIDGNDGADDFNVLASAVVGGDVNGGDDNDDMEIFGTVAGNVSGGGGNDALDIDNMITGTVFGDDGDDAIIVRTNGVANSIDGGDDTDTLTMDNLLSNTWEIQSPNTGTVAGQAFLDIENLIGNTENDIFEMQMTGTVESIDGGGGSNTLTGSDDQMNTWSVLTINAGELNGATFSNIQNLNGGALVDEFTLAGTLDGNLTAGDRDDTITLAGGSAMLIDGGDGSDTLIGTDVVNTWLVNAPNAGTLNTTQIFTGIENLIGGSAIDTFNINAQIDGNLLGNDDSDVFNLSAASAVGGDVSGGDDADDLNVDGTVAGSVSGGLGNDAIDINNAVTGSVLGDAGADNILISSTGSAILFDGGDDTDTLTYDNTLTANTDWTINADNAGVVNMQMFTNIENLAGDDAVIDTFTFAAAVSINSIDGGSGTDDVLTGSDNFNVWNVTSDNAGQLNGNTFTGIENLNGGTATDIFTLSAIIGGNITAGAGADNFAFQGAGAAASIDGGDDTDSIFGDHILNNWAITTSNSGTLNSQVFSNVENLTGGAAVDTFDITASLDGDINGGGDADVFTLAAAVAGTVSGMDGADSFVLSGAGAAANIDGGNDSDSLTGSDALNEWTVDAVNGGTVNAQDFVGIENLSGGGMVDTFNVNAQLDGAISGGGDADVFNLDAAVVGDVSGDDGGDSFVLQAGGSASNLDGGNGIDTLVGDNTVNVWTVATANSGTLNMQAFANIENLTGGSMMDSFNVNAQLDGDIDGGGGMDVFALAAAVAGDVAGDGGDDSFTLTGAGAANSLDGGAGNDTLNGDDIVNMWLVSGTNSGTVNTQAFMNVETLNGGEAADTFTVNAQLDGSISGNGGTDVVTTGALSSVGGSISGNAGADTITIGGAVAGNVTGNGGNDMITVSAATGGNVTGNAGNDAITIAGAVTGTVTGDNGDDTITVNANGAAQMIAGGTGNDALTYAAMVDNTWMIDADNAGTVNMQVFTGIENLTGGAQIDTFTINAGVAGNIDGGLGNDVFILSDQAAVTVGGVISGNGGNDTLSTMFIGGDRMFTYDGGAGTDAFLVSGNVVADYTGVFDAATGGLTYTAGAGVQQAILSNLESVSDQVLADSLQINSVVDVTLGAGTVAGQNPLNAMMGTLDFGFANKPNLDLNALTAGAGVSLVGAIMLPGTLDIDLGDGGTLMSDQGQISADSLIIRNAQIVSDLVTNVGSMMFDMVSGMFTVDEADDLALLGSDIDGSLTVNAGGALNVADGETVNSSNGLTLTSATTVSIDGNVSADALAINATDMQLNGTVTGSTSANLTGGAVTQGATGQFTSGSLTTNTTGGMSLLGTNAISMLDATNTNGDLVVNNASALAMKITNSGGVVDINNAGNLTINGLTNDGATDVDAINLTIAGNIATTGPAATTLTGSGAVMQNAVASAVGNLFINGNTINVASSASAQSSGGDVAYSGVGDITVSEITALNGSVLIASSMGDIFAAKPEVAITSDNIKFSGNGQVGLGVTPFAVYSPNGLLTLTSPTGANPNIDLFINDFGKFTTTGVRATNQRDLRAFATTSVFGQSLSSALSTGTDIDSNVFNIVQPDIVVPIGHGVTIPCGQIEDEEEACK